MSETSGMTAADWGLPELDPEEVRASMKWHADRNLETFQAILSETFGLEEYYYASDLTSAEVLRKVDLKEILVFELTPGITRVPIWQFDLAEDGRLTPNERIMTLWTAWGRETETLTFAEIISLKPWRQYGDTPANLVRQPDLDQTLWEDLMDTMETHGIQYM